MSYESHSLAYLDWRTEWQERDRFTIEPASSTLPDWCWEIFLLKASAHPTSLNYIGNVVSKNIRFDDKSVAIKQRLNLMSLSMAWNNNSWPPTHLHTKRNKSICKASRGIYTLKPINQHDKHKIERRKIDGEQTHNELKLSWIRGIRDLPHTHSS